LPDPPEAGWSRSSTVTAMPLLANWRAILAPAMPAPMMTMDEEDK